MQVTRSRDRAANDALTTLRGVQDGDLYALIESLYGKLRLLDQSNCGERICRPYIVDTIETVLRRSTGEVSMARGCNPILRQTPSHISVAVIHRTVWRKGNEIT